MPTIGIDSFSGYIPGYRLDPTLATELGVPCSLPLGAPDEDALTLTWETLGLINPAPRALVLRVPHADFEPRALVAHLAASDPQWAAKAVVPLAAGAGATAALTAAIALGAGTVAVIADHGRPANPLAPPSADGATAVRIGSNRVADLLATDTLPSLAYDRWRQTAETGAPDPRFVEETLLAVDGDELLGRLIKEAGVTRAELAGVVLSTCIPVRARRWAARWDVPAVWTAGPEYAAGRLAAATLRTAFERLAAAGPGSVIAVLELGWGGDGLLLRAGEGITDSVRMVSKSGAGAYAYRSWVSALSTSDSTIWTSPSKMRREAPTLVGLRGTRCQSCSDVAFPPRHVCDLCSHTDLHPVSLARTGTIVSHNLDRLFAAPGGEVQMVVVDLDGGGRFYGQLAAGSPRWAEVGDSARLVLRQLHNGGELPHYFWKAELT